MRDFEYLDGENIGNSHKGTSKSELHNGYSDAAPKGNYEGSLDDSNMAFLFRDGEFVEERRGTLHAGNIEADGFRSPHGADDEYGFVRRPTHKSDVERG